MKRRDFLRPRQLARAAGPFLDSLDARPAAAHGHDPFALLRATRPAMATTFEIALPFGTSNAQAAAQAALDVIDGVEDELTVYRPGSEISRLNRLAGTEAVRVDQSVFDLLAQCALLTKATEAAFDISAGPLIKAWGFFRRQGRVPTAAERADCLHRVGMQYVVLDGNAQTVTFTRPGMELNLGSIGKGYALDRAATLLRDDWGVAAALLHGGHSSVYAVGSEPGHERGWPVGIRHPWEPERRLAKVWLRNRALGTSAASFQHLEHSGRKLGHLLDPRSGWPAEGMASATVAAPTAAEADALATAFFIHGVDWARAYCGRHAEIGAVLLAAEAARPVIIGLTAPAVELVAP
jgi:thiamine biosynthesis lipoprotein